MAVLVKRGAATASELTGKGWAGEVYWEDGNVVVGGKIGTTTRTSNVLLQVTPESFHDLAFAMWAANFEEAVKAFGAAMQIPTGPPAAR
jgi:hypothetical protein